MHRTVTLIILVLTLLPAALGAQEILPQLKRTKPDLEEIRRAVTDRNSPYYYPTLMAEYERNDTLMKLNKFRYLYLGYMFQEDYFPYRPSSAAERINKVYNKPNPNRHETDSVIKYAQLALQDNPFNLTQMMGLIHALRLKGNTALADIWQYKLNYILMAIVSTGTGADEENAWYVIEPSHEYVLLNMMGYTVTTPLFYDPYYEYLKVLTPKGNDSGGFYFNIKAVLEEYYRKFPEELEMMPDDSDSDDVTPADEDPGDDLDL